jgi:uncharacterized protein (TIGR00299 family) protein
MKIAYLDCASGISGDMTLGALIDAGAPLAQIQAGINSLGLAGCKLTTRNVMKNGFRAVHLIVECPQQGHHHHHHHGHAHHDHTHTHDDEHRHLSQIVAMIDGSRLNSRQKDLAKRIFTRLGEAEAKVHGISIEKVHFHEVGAVDSIADIVGSAIALDLLGIERVVASPIPTGHGFIEIAHGRCSIPAPATAELLAGVPLAASQVEAELTTPTGAAIVATLVKEFGPPPPMTIQSIGYGAGQRDLKEQPNLLRVLIGQASGEAAIEQLVMLETNLDDIPGEQIGYALELLMAAGALDVTTTAIGMKKSRPGVMLSVLCRPADVDKLEAIMFHETTTLGVRRVRVGRHALARESRRVGTPYGPVPGKLATLPGGAKRFSPEYEACRQIAAAKNVPLREVFEAAQRAFATS